MYNWTLGEDDGWNLYKGFFQLEVEVLDVTVNDHKKVTHFVNINLMSLGDSHHHGPSLDESSQIIEPQW